MTWRGLIVGAAALALLLAGSPASAAPQGPDPNRPCEARQFESAAFTVCAYQRGANALEIAWKGPKGPYGGLKALRQGMGPRAAEVAFAMNAGMYDAAQGPVGLLVQGGVVRHAAETRTGSGNFYLLPNGVFSVDHEGRAHVEETRAFLAAPWRAVAATQSGPLLVQAGRLHRSITANGPSRLIRNGVGVKTPELAYFVISDQPVSFGQFARFFRDELGCPDALYLDGTVSSLWAPGLGRLDARAGLGPFVVVTKPKGP